MIGRRLGLQLLLGGLVEVQVRDEVPLNCTLNFAKTLSSLLASASSGAVVMRDGAVVMQEALADVGNLSLMPIWSDFASFLPDFRKSSLCIVRRGRR